MDPSQGPVERKAHGARMPTDPLPPGPLTKESAERKKKSKRGKQQGKHLKMLQIRNKWCHKCKMHDRKTEKGQSCR